MVSITFFPFLRGFLNRQYMVFSLLLPLPPHKNSGVLRYFSFEWPCLGEGQMRDGFDYKICVYWNALREGDDECTLVCLCVPLALCDIGNE